MQLNAAFAKFRTQNSVLAHEFDAIKLQASIFQFEIGMQYAGLIAIEPKGFALRVALKGLAHMLFSYEEARGSLLKRLRRLAESRQIELDEAALRATRRELKTVLESIATWRTLRNKAAAHYDFESDEQFEQVAAVEEPAVFQAATAVLKANMEFLKLLKAVGAGK